MTETAERRREDADVLALQMDALYKAAPASVLSIVGALIAVYVYWAPETQFGLTVWLVCVSSVAIVHLLSAALRRVGKPASWTALSWSRLVAGIYFASGLSWGVGGAWMLGHGNEQQALVICCLAMGAVTVTFPAVVYPPAYLLFQSPIFAVFAIGLAMSDMQFGAVLSFASALLCVFAGIIGQGMGSQLVLALRLSNENAKLVEELEKRGVALEAANRELEAQSLTDPLTGVANRRRLMTFIRAMPGPCAVMVVDVDHFKRYNDSFGHVDGDTCLTLVAEALQRSVRRGIDLVARHGGEEFTVVLAEVGHEQARVVAEEMRTNVQALFRQNPRQIRRLVTVSVGLACRGAERAKTIADLMEEADRAVYEAKKSGRNRVSTISGGSSADISPNCLLPVLGSRTA